MAHTRGELQMWAHGVDPSVNEPRSFASEDVMYSYETKGGFLVMTKNAFVPVERVFSLNKKFYCPTRE